MCLSVELEPVFSEVVDEIVKRVSEGAGCIEAARATVVDFRTLLEHEVSDQVDRSRIAGLVGELIILNRLLDMSPIAWRSWRGPAGDRHDFRAANTSLEVKASQRAGSVIVTINGLDQLEPPSGGSLHLAHFILEPVSGGLLTIAGLGERALARADDPAGLRLLFAGLGCLDVRDSKWNQHSFRVEGESIYRVDGEFPRIVPSGFSSGISPAGIMDVTYLIDLSFALGCKCLPSSLAEVLWILAQ